MGGRRGGLGTQGVGRQRGWVDGLRLASLVDLANQISASVGQHHPRHGLYQDAILVGNLVGRPHEDAARSIGHVGLTAGCDEPHDLVMQDLPVAGMILVPDHEIHLQSAPAPVGVGLDQLADQFDVCRIPDLEQNDGQIAGDGIAPQTGLPAAVPLDHARVGAQQGVGIEDGPGQTPIQLRIGFAGVDLSQRHLAVCPGQIEDTVRQPPVLVFVDQSQTPIACLAHTGDDVDGR